MKAMLCGCCGEAPALIFVKALPKLCVACARKIHIARSSELRLDYVTAQGFADAMAKPKADAGVRAKAKPKARRSRSDYLKIIIDV